MLFQECCWSERWADFTSTGQVTSSFSKVIDMQFACLQQQKDSNSNNNNNNKYSDFKWSRWSLVTGDPDELVSILVIHYMVQNHEDRIWKVSFSWGKRGHKINWWRPITLRVNKLRQESNYFSVTVESFPRVPWWWSGEEEVRWKL